MSVFGLWNVSTKIATICKRKSSILQKAAMSSYISFPKSVIKTHQIKPPLSRVELHVHLDGSMRRETLFELLKTKNLDCPGDGSFKAFERAVEVRQPKDLQQFLAAFSVFMPA